MLCKLYFISLGEITSKLGHYDTIIFQSLD